MAICRGCGKDIRDDVWVCGYCGELVGRSDGVGSSNGAAGTSAGSGYLSAGVSGDAPPTFTPSPPGGSYGAPGGSGAANGYDAGGSYGVPSPQPSPAPLPASSSSSSSKGLGSRTVTLIGVFGLVAVVAIVGVWFFLLRGGGGDFSAYVGSWEMDMPDVASGFTINIRNNDGEPQLMMCDAGTTPDQAGAQSIGPFKMELHGGELATELEIADDVSEEQKAAAEAGLAGLGTIIEDFRMVFSEGTTADTLSLTIEGEIQGEGTGAFTSMDMSTRGLTLKRVGTSASQAL